MSTDLENLESIYSKLYEISLQIAQLLEKELYTELITYLSKKDRLLGEASLYIEKLKGKDIDTEKLRQICIKYQEQETKNIAALTGVKDEIKKELAKTTKDRKLLGAYGSNKEYVQGSILDYRE